MRNTIAVITISVLVAAAPLAAHASKEENVGVGTGAIVGAIQWYEEDDPDYRHAGIDLFLDPEVHGRGLGTDAIRALAGYLFTVEGHHRLIIDPAASNLPAIRANEKVGFRRVGTMRRYERDADGVWQDGILMELLAEDLK